MEIRLQRNADAPRSLSAGSKQLERAIHIRGALHVDPYRRLGDAICVRNDPVEIPLTDLCVEIEPELRRFDRYLRVQATALDAVEHIDVVLGHFVGLVELRDVFS